jgi:hypothetical protein
MKKMMLVVSLIAFSVFAQGTLKPCLFKWQYPTPSNAISFNIREFVPNSTSYSAWPLVATTKSNQIRLNLSETKFYTLLVTNSTTGVEEPLSWTVPVIKDFSAQ